MQKSPTEDAKKDNQAESYLNKYGWNPRKWTVDDFQNFLDDIGLTDMKCFFSYFIFSSSNNLKNICRRRFD